MAESTLKSGMRFNNQLALRMNFSGDWELVEFERLGGSWSGGEFAGRSYETWNCKYLGGGYVSGRRCGDMRYWDIIPEEVIKLNPKPVVAGASAEVIT